MLNPSTADAHTDDATTRRVLRMAEEWGYGSYEAVNLFAYRSVSPKILKTAPYPIGPENNDAILKAVQHANLVVAAWGTHGVLYDRNLNVIRLLEPAHLHCLHITKNGHPGHPLYLKSNVKPIPFRPCKPP